ncbi:hypothetical protein B2J77_15890 [Pseudomonas parafulva]|uniref:Uncharacterized protein n=1 Tax=Pseudomonas parafulva TaxID=157782 RepID=A0ABN4Y2N9_9PSED|nr:hypothetical protein B2J77_15890 [Pseudomonas parafulva]
MGSAKTQELPITKQFFAGLILRNDERAPCQGYPWSVHTRQFFEMHCD